MTTTDTHTAEWREAQAEHVYQESRKLALDAPTDDAPSLWEYGQGEDDTWLVVRLCWNGYEWDTNVDIWDEDASSVEMCPTRDAARALATTRNTPPHLQSNSPESTPATVTGEGEEER